MLFHQFILIQADFSERCTIQAIIRTGPIISPGGSDGNLLKAQSDEEIKLSVDFTGTDTTDSQQSGIQVLMENKHLPTRHHTSIGVVGESDVEKLKGNLHS